MNITSWFLAVTGSALVLTQSTIAAPLRDWFGPRIIDGEEYEREGLVWRFLGKLVNCPMCCGFWLGLAWAAILGTRGTLLVAYAFGGSIVSALAVAMWLTLQEAHQALALWRWRMNPETPDACETVASEQAIRMPMAEIVALLNSAERPLFDEDGAARWGLWTRDGKTELLTHWGLLRELSSLLSHIAGDADTRVGVCDVISTIEANGGQIPHVVTANGVFAVSLYSSDNLGENQ